MTMAKHAGDTLQHPRTASPHATSADNMKVSLALAGTSRGEPLARSRHQYSLGHIVSNVTNSAGQRKRGNHEERPRRWAVCRRSDRAAGNTFRSRFATKAGDIRGTPLGKGADSLGSLGTGE